MTNKRKNNGIAYECILCQKEKSNLYNQNHKEEIREAVRNYKLNYPDRVRESSRKSIVQKLKRNLVNRLRDLINQRVTGKSQLVGCDYEFLKKYLEDHFEPGMSWENYGNGVGKWEIDHIKPLAYFNLEIESERKIAGHYTNLRPLWSKDNGDKSDLLPNGKRGRDCRKLIETDPLFL